MGYIVKSPDQLQWDTFFPNANKQGTSLSFQFLLSKEDQLIIYFSLIFFFVEIKTMIFIFSNFPNKIKSENQGKLKTAKNK